MSSEDVQLSLLDLEAALPLLSSRLTYTSVQLAPWHEL
jgi:hypothetical protein